MRWRATEFAATSKDAPSALVFADHFANGASVSNSDRVFKFWVNTSTADCTYTKSATGLTVGIRTSACMLQGAGKTFSPFSSWHRFLLDQARFPLSPQGLLWSSLCVQC
jgi:hypothetical protein